MFHMGRPSTETSTIRRLLCFLAVGSWSPFWFCLQLWLKQFHAYDVAIISNVGRLSTLLLKTGGVFQSVQSPQVDIDEIHSICDGLLGKKADSNVPEILDDSVKLLLEAWAKHFDRFIRVSAHDQNSTRFEMALLVEDVNAAANMMHAIVDEAARCADDRIQSVFTASFCGLVVAVLLAVSVTYVARRIFMLHGRAVLAHQKIVTQQTAFLSASFDAIIKVRTQVPYEVMMPNPQLDHIIGQPMFGQSIFDCTKRIEEAQRMEHFLKSPASQQSFPQKHGLGCCGLASADVQIKMTSARVLCTTWSCMGVDGGANDVGVELFQVPGPIGLNYAWLALRLRSPTFASIGNADVPELAHVAATTSEVYSTHVKSVENIVSESSTRDTADTDTLDAALVAVASMQPSWTCPQLMENPDSYSSHRDAADADVPDSPSWTCAQLMETPDSDFSYRNTASTDVPESAHAMAPRLQQFLTRADSQSDCSSRDSASTASFFYTGSLAG